MDILAWLRHDSCDIQAFVSNCVEHLQSRPEQIRRICHPGENCSKTEQRTDYGGKDLTRTPEEARWAAHDGNVITHSDLRPLANDKGYIYTQRAFHQQRAVNRKS